MKKILTLPKVDGETYSDYAYRTLRNNIMQMTLEPGEAVDEYELADILSISRTPVHEAILRLKDEYLVEVIPRKNMTITKINLSYVSEGTFWRCLVEPAVVKSLVNNVPGEYAEKLWENLQFQEKLINEHADRTAFYAADDEFHKLLYLAANKELIYSKKRYITSHLDRVRYIIRILGNKDLESPSYMHHMRIYQLIMFGGVVDKDFVDEYVRHISAFQETLPDIMKANPNYFEAGHRLELSDLLWERDFLI